MEAPAVLPPIDQFFGQSLIGMLISLKWDLLTRPDGHHLFSLSLPRFPPRFCFIFLPVCLRVSSLSASLRLDHSFDTESVLKISSVFRQ